MPLYLILNVKRFFISVRLTSLRLFDEKRNWVKSEKRTLPAGFEPTRGDPIGFQVQRLNHSATAAWQSDSLTGSSYQSF